MEKIDKYEIVREIGLGGMGKVYEARDSVLGRIVAIKLMLEAQHLDEEMRARFYREAQAAGNLKHPNVVTIHDLAEENGVPYIVMEYLEGNDLKELLDKPESLSSTERLSVAAQVAKGLAYAHQNGIVHRDIKPDNIRVLEDGQAKIMDFGIAHIPSSEITKSGLTVGTWDYMSPEQITGEKIDRRTDIWSLGVIIYEMLAARRPFECESVATLVYKIAHQEPPSFESLGVDVPGPLAAVVLKALARSPGDRYQDAGELGTDLERHVSALSTEIDHLHAEIERDVQKYSQLASALCLKKQFDEGGHGGASGDDSGSGERGREAGARARPAGIGSRPARKTGAQNGEAGSGSHQARTTQRSARSDRRRARTRPHGQRSAQDSRGDRRPCPRVGEADRSGNTNRGPRVFRRTRRYSVL